MQSKTSRKQAFTLIELMIVVSIIGVLAAIAIPAFMSYVKQTKASEASSNLKAILSGAISYYADERPLTGLPAAGGAAISNTRCTVSDAATNNQAGSQKTRLDWSLGSHASFKDLGFAPSDPLYYHYRVDTMVPTAGTCGDTSNQGPIYSFIAEGDLDDDNISSLFVLEVGLDADGNLYQGGGVVRSNITE